ncbi:MAG: MBL fold metallo-hydrolase [bacterium]|nr:MBL fold metallo-hydrolase [bacterium]
MLITIHRGSHEIGGTCIQVSTANCSILLDLGRALRRDSIDPDLEKIKVDAVLVSHPHMDHYGLIDVLDKSVPVYIGELSRKLIDTAPLFLGRKPYDNNFHTYKSWKPFSIGDFTITPYLVDHSATDAHAFLIEAVGKRIFYSGDFRAHGRKRICFDRIVANPPRDLDLLFLEGTLIERSNDKYPTEESVEQKIYETIKDQQYITFIISSAQNIDRLVSAYKACHKAKKTLVLDFYAAWVLELAKKVSRGIRAMDWNYIRVYANHGQDQTLKKNEHIFEDFRQRIYQNFRVKPAEIRACPEKYVEFARISQSPAIASFKKNGRVNLIYSQWEGYLKYSDKDYLGAEAMAAFRKDPNVNFICAHTSGHATLCDLKTFTQALNPGRLIPVHTEHAHRFREHFENVLELKDGVDLTV